MLSVWLALLGLLTALTYVYSGRALPGPGSEEPSTSPLPAFSSQQTPGDGAATPPGRPEAPDASLNLYCEE